jgi:hypothetical protein
MNSVAQDQDQVSPDSDYHGAEVQSLADRICLGFKPSHYQNGGMRKYLPEGSVERLITNDSVYKELEPHLSKENDTSLIPFILTKANKVFALTCVVLEDDRKVYKAMKLFQKEGFDNRFLPAEFETSSHGIKPTNPHVKAFGGVWTTTRLEDFNVKQWQFLAPVFREGNLLYGLDDRYILPFKQVGKDTKDGTFGDIFQVKIHPNHLDKCLSQVND